MSVCLPLQAVWGTAAGFHLHVGPDARRPEGQAAGESLQKSSGAAEGPAERESGRHLPYVCSVFIFAFVRFTIKVFNCCVPADVHVQLYERRGFAKLYGFAFRHAALLQVSTLQTKIGE